MARANAGVLELFAGLGSVAQGFADTGHFGIAGLTDIDDEAFRTVSENVPGVPYLRVDVRQVDANRLREFVGDTYPVTGLLGCPPCQGFSAAGRRRDDDVRNELLSVYFDMVSALDPPFFVMENVPAVLWKPSFAKALEGVSERYVTWTGILNAALYGLPQTRQRAIVIGYRRDLDVCPTPPAPTHAGSREVFDYRTGQLVRPTYESLPKLLGHYPVIGVPRAASHAARHLPAVPLEELADLVTVGEAIDDLPAEFGARYAKTQPSAYARSLREDSKELANHNGWRHRPDLVLRLSNIAEGGLPGAAHGRSETYFSQAYGRLHSAGLARTVTTNFHNPGSGRFTHHSADRSLSIREAARLQGLPDSFVLSGHLQVQERLIGNAFPRPWARAIGEHVWEQLHDVLGI